MSAPGEVYRFRLGRDASGAYVGELVDDWGWVIAITAQEVERDGVRVFEGIGALADAMVGIDNGKLT
ncbi:hypothetical protein HN018_22045 (plasmid) [Lichenicola cladoniae]|uniref:Uncharacterized protein n=1 Tax=Lichenicola cladoniae TaxID=1484109 RepID=A0A6M8HWY0_9PROT|nr:hypothetical protein [Lichenicola cladoniae]NPD69754.1 hypothetical protein [Acetobacteraceae bacterium]QKE92912.1 hypothetical protein HN018_22045 [Lichenicola cladoniae]